MDDFLNNPLLDMQLAKKAFDEFKRKSDKALQHKFSGQIKGNFLIATKENVAQQLATEIAKYYDLTLTDEKLVSNGMKP